VDLLLLPTADFSSRIGADDLEEPELVVLSVEIDAVPDLIEE